jgi:hypothetical protein
MMTPDAGASNLRLETGRSVSLAEEREAAVDALRPGARRNLGGTDGASGAVSGERGIFLPSPSTTVFGPYYHRRSLVIASR